ncbi:MAG: hypothetical protein JXD22_13335 [Sedimentisphaerales bacterium]|nr:hypothetical protein [Sedimentisphaerales bacterium]
MGRKEQIKGKCLFCGHEATRAGMGKHFSKCSPLQEKINNSAKGKGKQQILFHLLVQDAWGGDFWLHMEMNGSAKLEELDSYLRYIWLECCGHMSNFTIGKQWGDEIPMRTKAERIFKRDITLFHTYDFGTSSETLVKVIGEREGSPLTKHPIVLMARNNLPEVSCMKCSKVAKWMCQECQIEHDESGLLCDEHVKNHPHDDYGEPIKIVNSPRLGMCGYDGPADPPY